MTNINELRERASSMVRARLQLLAAMVGCMLCAAFLLIAFLFWQIWLGKEAGGMALGVVATQFTVLIVVSVGLIVRKSRTSRTMALALHCLTRRLESGAKVNAETTRATIDRLFANGSTNLDASLSVALLGVFTLAAAASVFVFGIQQEAKSYGFVVLLTFIGAISAIAIQIVLQKPSSAETYLEIAIDRLDGVDSEADGRPVPELTGSLEEQSAGDVGL